MVTAGMHADGRLCDAVQCGRGKCKVNTNETFGFVCDCEPGWTKPQIGSYFQFLPCVIPNSCNWSLCGGGTCVRTSAFGHRCDCNPGFGNLLNITDFPCFRPCKRHILMYMIAIFHRFITIAIAITGLPTHSPSTQHSYNQVPGELDLVFHVGGFPVALLPRTL
ncbi:hypothetical protein Taro_009531 [Colocasia esculenta]|uniref:EGF-like domain-containing protein n=1 Tax=Colocasia esculenta TaxID=4460 RepID=A0A843U122_COLES|nr:hypothetical protein [Colocasia esculenta]